MNIPSYKEILMLLKKGATIEAQEKIMQLRETLIELQEENIKLRNTIIELEEKFKGLEAFDGDPCPKCRRPGWVVESSKPDRQFGALGGIRRNYKCNECGFSESQLITPK